jgi:hypothetical protein
MLVVVPVAIAAAARRGRSSAGAGADTRRGNRSGCQAGGTTDEKPKRNSPRGNDYSYTSTPLSVCPGRSEVTLGIPWSLELAQPLLVRAFPVESGRPDFTRA